ncbi:hypothetical protein F4560_001900 [Saccharothrix ecbatanensis]|uniref:Uncharacterized protein n=1 Tax=Saccharothrix ecbatanensis TaxID=1105145 RepID=A0A7W9HH02_9PSEU|nr:hypothetical protein [Saccharothrix ecbatanensis]MBB5802132.1 hypothetical protein [Saccharothrix ecbatanensis]
MTRILELRVLPPLAIGRLGAAAEPMDNYTAEPDPDEPLAPRVLVPAPTLRVDPDSGEIVDDKAPEQLRFTDGHGKVKPVAPFLEVWALTDDDRKLHPLTVDLLRANKLEPKDVRWCVRVGNHKIERRTYNLDDRIDADTGWFSDHGEHGLNGECANFLTGKTLPLGHARYIKPTTKYPGIRLRFTPAAGNVYGSGGTVGDHDPNVVDALYDATKGTWRGHVDEPGDPRLTIPGQIYAGDDEQRGWVSRGYLDDECDGLVHVELTVDGRKLKAYGRIGAGPPAYAPDSIPVRTIADELDQALYGPKARREDTAEDAHKVAEEVLRRALESVRLMNTAVMNGNTVDGRVDAASTMVRQDSADTGRTFEPIMAPSLVDTAAVFALHQNVLAALRSGTAPWFADVLRDHDEVGDLSAKGRRKMPALMRGADGRSLALTRRQVDLVRKAARQEIFRQENLRHDRGADESGGPA